jgi:tetratricopeptide (TPR) repeat protein
MRVAQAARRSLQLSHYRTHRRTLVPRSSGNTALKAARQAAGISSQAAFIAALSEAARQLGLGSLTVSQRQIARWESATPGWPREDYQRLLTHVLKVPITELGFTPPWGQAADANHTPMPAPAARRPAVGRSVPLRVPRSAGRQPDTIGADYAAITATHRRMYWTVTPASLHPAIAEHGTLGETLLSETSGIVRTILASALAEELLLAGRIEFFDLRQPVQAETTLHQALQAAGEADDSLLGSAVLAHMAFIPGWDGRRDDAIERMQAARTYARRAPASTEFLAWLDAVEAECLTRCGDYREALDIYRHADDVLAAESDRLSPAWFDWFNPDRLAGFRGNTELLAGLIPQARTTLQGVLDALGNTDGKQRVVVLGDLAAVEAAAKRPAEACTYLDQAIDQLALTWYATGMDRVRDAHRALAPWRDLPEVQRIDDRLYSWPATISALQR